MKLLAWLVHLLFGPSKPTCVLCGRPIARRCDEACQHCIDSWQARKAW